MESSNFALRGTQLWPTMIFTRHWERHAQESPEIINFLYSLRQSQSRAIDSHIAEGSKSQTGLYESGFDLFKEQNSGLQQLVRFIESTLALAVSIANDQQYAPEHLAIEIVDSWYHITNENGFHDAHVHHGCSWCGIYYLRLGAAGKRAGTGAPNGGSRFYCPFALGGSYRDFGNDYLASSIDPPISDGMLMLFPSYLWHSGLPYSGEVDRMVLAFNARAFVKAEAVGLRRNASR